MKLVIEINKELYQCSTDYTKAFDRINRVNFDRINHAKLITFMKKANIPEHETRLIANYTVTKKQ